MKFNWLAIGARRESTNVKLDQRSVCSKYFYYSDLVEFNWTRVKEICSPSCCLDSQLFNEVKQFIATGDVAESSGDRTYYPICYYPSYDNTCINNDNGETSKNYFGTLSRTKSGSLCRARTSYPQNRACRQQGVADSAWCTTEEGNMESCSCTGLI